MKRLVVENLTKLYKMHTPGNRSWWANLLKPNVLTVTALDNINLDVELEQTLAFVGANGSGKSTLVKLICGIIRPTSGTIRVMGLDPFRDRTALAQRTGVVFGQKSLLLPDLSLQDSLDLYGRVYGLRGEEVRSRMEMLDGYFSVTSFVQQPVRKLSLGQRMRGEIVAAILHTPELLILDEPSIGLDYSVREHLARYLQHRGAEGLATILITHDLDLVTSIDARVVQLAQGRIVAGAGGKLDVPGWYIQAEYGKITSVASYANLAANALRLKTIDEHTIGLFVAREKRQEIEMHLVQSVELVSMSARPMTYAEAQEFTGEEVNGWAPSKDMLASSPSH